MVGMYRSYKQCGFGPVYNLRSVGYTPPVVTNVAAVPESVRVTAETCPSLFVTTNVIAPCAANSTISVVTTNKQTTLIPTVPGAPISYVTVGTVPASRVVQAKAQAAVAQSFDPYNPDTRFSQYFPPAPAPYCPPVRPPNNDPLPSVNVCLPIRRFTGVTEN